MAFLISPGVQVNEIDLTNIIPALATSTGAYAGHFSWGPVGQLVTVSSEKDLAKNFGVPDASTEKSFFTAASFLKYGNNLKVSRACSESAKNATGAVSGASVDEDEKLLIRNLDEYESFATPLSSAAITARYPGIAGNSIRVIIARPTLTAFNASDTLKNNFTSAPSSTSYAENYRSNIGANENEPILDEIHVLVIDEKGVISGTPGSILERYEGLSLASDAKTESGATNYYKNVINASSSHIYITSLSALGVPEWEAADQTIAQVYSSGTSTVTAALNASGAQQYDSSEFDFNTYGFQSETATILASTDPITAGTVIVAVTSALITNGTPVNVTANLTVADDTIAKVATKIRNALAATASIDTHFTVSGTGADITLTARIRAAADNTLNIALTDNGTADGFQPDLTSVNTTGGLEPVVVSNIIGSDGNPYSIAVTVETSAGGLPVTAALIATADEVAVTVTVTTVQTINGATQTPNSEEFNLIIKENVEGNIYVDTAGLDFKITINSNEDAIVISPAVFQISTGGGGYDDPTSAGLQNIVCGGAVVGPIGSSAINSALDLFADKETVDVNFIFTENFVQVDDDTYFGSSQQTIDNSIADIVNTRKDCVGFISAPLDMSTTFSESAKKDFVTKKASALNSSSYLIMDSTPVYVYNKYSDSYVWISAGGHMAGLCANADRVADAWFSPAGLNRGGLLGVTKLAYNANQTDRDDIYKLGVNPIVSFPGQGILLYGDKTLQKKPSAFDRINVRRLFITLEKAIASAAKFQLFEQNDDFTRSSFRNAIIPFLRDVQGRRGITDFRVVCDSTNNTGEVIDGNRFVADIYIKPTRSINYITLNFISTRTGVEFREIVG